MSIWVIERVFMVGRPVPLAMVPFYDESTARQEAKRLQTIYGGEINAVEYKRVEKK